MIFDDLTWKDKAIREEIKKIIKQEIKENITLSVDRGYYEGDEIRLDIAYCGETIDSVYIS